MSFIRFTNPEGAAQVINVDRINGATYKKADASGQKSRVAIEIAGEETAVFVHGEEAGRLWATLQRLVAE